MTQTHPPSPKSAVLQKLQELEASLTRNRQATPGSGSDPLEQSTLATLLFGSAPAGFIVGKQAAELVAIAERAAGALRQFTQGQHGPLVAIHAHHEGVSIYVVNLDRPFIINTITEAVRDVGGEITTLLHPIIKLEQQQVSLAYLEVIGVAPSDFQPLELSLRESLTALATVTDDFTAMLVRTDTLGRILENPPRNSGAPQAERREILEFLRWLADGGFVFLGYSEWSESDGLHRKSSLGLYNVSSCAEPLIAESCREISLLEQSGEIIGIARLRSKSIVHRRSRMLHLVIEEPVADSRSRTFHTIIGMLTSKARGQESSSVPLIRRSLQKLIEMEQATPNSYHYKSIVNLIDHMPKEEALCLEVNTLHQAITDTLTIHGHEDIRIAILTAPAKIAATFLIVMPRDRFNTEARKKLQTYVEELVGARRHSSEYLLDVSDRSLARFYFSVAPAAETLPALDPVRVLSEVRELMRDWRENVRQLLDQEPTIEDSSALLRRYGDAFPNDYLALSKPQEIIADLTAIETLTEGTPMRLRLESLGANGIYSLSLYSRGGDIALGRSLGILENAGFEVLHERTFRITPLSAAPLTLQRFEVRSKLTTIEPTLFENIAAPGLIAVFSGAAVSDPLNQLLLGEGLHLRAVALLRAYSAFLAQANKFATRHAIYNALAGTSSAARKLWEIFSLKFDPSLTVNLDERKRAIHELEEDYQDILSSVPDITQDRILRGLGILLSNTVRTNFYTNSQAIALKLHSAKTEILPQPRPLFEIFVSSPIVEGIHLRSSMVARGGIRWSDRKDDYRTEVLGLMKTQKIKNVVIVPSGAKGGFIVRTLPEDPTQIKPAVENAYREYIRALLSLADNRVHGKVVAPPQVLAYDGEDPYFVVAADKGTATFSDIANSIATQEYGFWLGDAFASGGSNGYDHKKYAITAKGAWECAKRHFAEAGIDYQHRPFSVIGIGDMSGDVFGNGLLLSKNMALVAAFDHRSIFIDPTPDPLRSFEERKRLFEAKGSSWNDYRRDLLSKGGGVYGRYDKEITPSKEARHALGIGDEVPATVNGEQLISYILRAPVDLLWNGGIGTYVKSAAESNSDVNDSTNDRVRVNAEELRVKVVAEGGNLGFTQRGRVAFARAGGHINTDAIDNSGGVDLSDHEVNLKLLLNGLLADGKLTLEQRNTLLKEMADEVCDLVLSHNASHALALSLGVARSRRNIEYVKELLKQMSKLGYVNRSLEALPEDEELDERARRKEGLVRPEVAVCHAVVKMWSQDFLSRSSFIKDPLLQDYLLSYFPPRLVVRFRDEILAHPLAREIITTEVSNQVIDAVSISFIHRLAVHHAADPVWVISCAVASERILPFASLRQHFKSLDNAAHNQRFLLLHTEIARTLRAAAGWMVTAHEHTTSLSSLVELYKAPFFVLAGQIEQVLSGREREVYEERLHRDADLKLPDFERKCLALLPLIIPVMEMLFAARTSSKEVTLVGQIYSQMVETLGISKFIVLGTPIEAQSRWDNELLIHSYEDIRRALSVIACALLSKGALRREDAARMITGSPTYEHLTALLTELREGTPSPAALSVVARTLAHFVVGE